MVQLFALEENLGAAVLLGQALGIVQRAGAANELGVEAIQFGDKVRLGARLVVGLLQVENQRHQGFGNEAPTELAELALCVGIAAVMLVGTRHDFTSKVDAPTLGQTAPR